MMILEEMNKANAMILDHATKDSALKGMGCTLLAAMIDNSHATISQVGDCRGYLWRERSLTQVTTDHSIVARMIAEGTLTPEKAEYHPDYHVLECAIGVREELGADVRTVNIQPDDRLLFCSNGLWNMIIDKQIAAILSENNGAESCVTHLITEANHMAGEDNITVVVVDIIEREHI